MASSAPTTDPLRSAARPPGDQALGGPTRRHRTLPAAGEARSHRQTKMLVGTPFPCCTLRLHPTTVWRVFGGHYPNGRLYVNWKSETCRFRALPVDLDDCPIIRDHGDLLP